MSSKRRIRRRQCIGKIRHETQEAAIRHCHRLQDINHVLYGAYKCQFCKGWHSGRPNKAQKQPLMARMRAISMNRAR